MQLSQVLFSQGFGTRRECAALIASGLVMWQGRVLDNPAEELPTTGLTLHVRDQPWPFHARALVMLHKPAGFECSQKPRHHPSVLTLLPPPLRTRGVQPVGRLDEDTTGLLLLTDHGPWLHRLTHPKRHVDKTYRVSTASDVEPAQVSALQAGVLLKDDPKPARAVACEQTGARELLLTIDEGRYHQVKRMLAAVGNPVLALHRTSFGSWALPEDLPPGQWRYLPPPD